MQIRVSNDTIACVVFFRGPQHHNCEFSDSMYSEWERYITNSMTCKGISFHLDIQPSLETDTALVYKTYYTPGRSHEAIKAMQHVAGIVSCQDRFKDLLHSERPFTVLSGSNLTALVPPPFDPNPNLPKPNPKVVQFMRREK